jgi:hypothetical protein
MMFRCRKRTKHMAAWLEVQNSEYFIQLFFFFFFDIINKGPKLNKRDRESYTKQNKICAFMEWRWLLAKCIYLLCLFSK